MTFGDSNSKKAFKTECLRKSVLVSSYVNVNGSQ